MDPMLMTREGFSEVDLERSNGKQLMKVEKRILRLTSQILQMYLRLGQAEDALQVQIHHLLKGIFWILIDRSCPVGSGIVDEDIEI